MSNKAVLNVGCGNLPAAGAVNLDVSKHRPEVDVVHDLNVIPWPFPDASFDTVIARAVFEHLRITLIETVNECWRILRPDGLLYMKLPHWQSNISYIDPTHHWQFALETCTIFDPDTRFGSEYSFYTPLKWKIVKGPELNKARSSIHVTLRKAGRVKTGEMHYAP